MTNLAVEIAGVRFPNPVVVNSSSLTKDMRRLRALAEAGAGGIITKTISPDPMKGTGSGFRAAFWEEGWGVAGDARLTMEQGCELIAAARRELDIPIIADLIGRSDDAGIWGESARRLEQADAHMIELDLNGHPEGGLKLDVPESFGHFDVYSIGQEPAATARVVRAVCDAVSIPVVSKMTLRAPDILGVARASAEAGAHVITGVNALQGIRGIDIERGGRPVLPGFDTHSLGPICGPELYHLGLRWTMLLVTGVDRPYISGSGIMNARNAIERIMLGAAATAICSSIYYRGYGAVTETVEGIRAFMQRNGYDTIEDFRGKALEFIAPRGSGDWTPTRPFVVDENAWREVGVDVFRRAEVECACIRCDGDTVSFDPDECRGCGLPKFLAPHGVVEMRKVEA